MISIIKIFVPSILFNMLLFGHCQIPCGIYSDAIQILQIKEDLQTIEKSIKNIKELSRKIRSSITKSIK